MPKAKKTDNPLKSEEFQLFAKLYSATLDESHRLDDMVMNSLKREKERYEAGLHDALCVLSCGDNPKYDRARILIAKKLIYRAIFEKDLTLETWLNSLGMETIEELIRYIGDDI